MNDVINHCPPAAAAEIHDTASSRRRPGLNVWLSWGYCWLVMFGSRFQSIRIIRFMNRGSIKNKRRKHSLPINSTNFHFIFYIHIYQLLVNKWLRLGLGLGLVLVSKDSIILTLTSA